MYCRLCLNKYRVSEFISLLSFTDGLNWMKLCWKYLHIEIKSNDNYSKGICQNCTKNLKEFHGFCQHAQHCQQLLPQLHSKMKEAKNRFEDYQKMSTETTSRNLPNQKSVTKPFEHMSCLEIELRKNHPKHSQTKDQEPRILTNQEARTETLQHKNSSEINFQKKGSTCMETFNVEDQVSITVKKEIVEDDAELEIPVTENVNAPTEQKIDKKFQHTLAIKAEPFDEIVEPDARTPHHTAQIYTSTTLGAVIMTANEKDAIKVENCFESTEYGLHEPAPKSHITEEIPAKKFKTNLKGTTDCSNYIQSMELNQNMEPEQVYSKNLQQVDSPFDLDKNMFRKIYRLPPNFCQDLIQSLDSRLRGSRITVVSSEKLVLAALRFYATGLFHDNLLFGANMSRAILKVTDAINENLCQSNIRFPMNEIEREAAKNAFAAAPTAPFNGAIGVIDCMHVRISTPDEKHKDVYLNKHGYHSINVQMVCDASLQILNVNARYPGSKDNAYIWNASAARGVMNRAFINGDRNAFLIGDAKYPLEPWLMTPFNNSVIRTPEFRYNESLYEARKPIQRLFAILKGTWRCLSSETMLTYHPQLAGRIVNSCSVLHNLRLSQTEYDPEEFIDLEISQDNFDKSECLLAPTDLVLFNTAKRIQNHILLKHFSN